MRLIDSDKLSDSIWALRSKYQMMDDGQAASKSLAVLRQIEQMVERAEKVNAEPTITEESAIDYLRSTGWLQRHDKALTEFLEFLWQVINPNEMEQYWSMFNAREEKSNE